MNEDELIQKYYDHKNAEAREKRNAEETLERLALLAPHKKGEIIRWKETGRTKNVGTTWHPNRIALPDMEREAVLVKVTAKINTFFRSKDVDYDYEFSPIKNDGGISQNHVYPRSDFEWTGEIHKDYKE